MITEQNLGAHSAYVEMRLRINGDSISITQMGPDFLLIEPARAHPPCDAMVSLQVDQSYREWKVRLPHGISEDCSRVLLAACD